jgi:hypothetical protein
VARAPGALLKGPTRRPLQQLRAQALVPIQPNAWNMNSRKFISKILHSPAPIPLQSPTPSTPLGPVPLELVTPMDRYARWLMPS